MNRNNKNNQNEVDQTGEVISWVIIFILMFAFPPLGLLLLILKMRSYAKPNKDSARKPGKRTSTYSSGSAPSSIPTSASNSASNSVSTPASSPSPSPSQPLRYAPETTGSLRPASQPKPTQTNSGKPIKKKDRKQLEKKSGRVISVVFLLISVALFVIGASTIFGAASSIWGDGVNAWGEFWMGAFYLSGGVISLISRGVFTRKFTRYKNYHAFLTGRTVVRISDISQTQGISARVVKRDLQTMINSGYFEFGTYIDYELDSLVLCSDTAEEIRSSAKSFQEDFFQSEEPRENQYMSTISELRELNYSIADISISNKIDKIEELTAKIFRHIEEHPEKQPQIRRFVSYYLPTTIKLLRSYSTLEKQGVKGENIMAAKENIGRILDTLALGYEQQLDQLFRADAMDIAADISVLENLMQQDGLSGERNVFKTMEGT